MVQWNDDALTTIKETLANATLLSHPKPDVPTNIVTDASNIAVGAVLQQYINYCWCPIAYFSKKFPRHDTVPSIESFWPSI